MIGAVMAKRAVAQSYDAISRQDLDALQARHDGHPGRAEAMVVFAEEA